MKYREAVNQGAAELRAADVPDADLDAWYLLEFCLNQKGIPANRSWYLLHREETISQEEAEEYARLLKLRGKRIPLQHITGEQEFMGLTFQVNEHVLIPRQDTEILVEEAMKKAKKGSRVLDMCTGSGCILISLLKLVPGLSGVGADISGEALKVAKRNAEVLSAEADFVESDLFSEVNGRFDLIVSNPPYIPTKVVEGLMEEVREHEPWNALDGMEDGLHFYRRITEECGAYLNPGGWLLFEIGYDQAEAVMELLKKAGFLDVCYKKDLAGLDRVVVGRKPEAGGRENV